MMFSRAMRVNLPVSPGPLGGRNRSTSAVPSQLFPTNTTLSVAEPFDPGAAEAGAASSAQATTAIAADATLNAIVRLPPVIARHTLIGEQAICAPVADP
jgi:hypothetical protein